MSFLHTIVTTHYIRDAPSEDFRKDVLLHASEGAKYLYTMVLKGNQNLSTAVVKPQYLMSTDDTTQYIFLGIGKSKHFKWKLVSSDAHKKKSTHSIHQVMKDSQKQGL